MPGQQTDMRNRKTDQRDPGSQVRSPESRSSRIHKRRRRRRLGHGSSAGPPRLAVFAFRHHHPRVTTNLRRLSALVGALAVVVAACAWNPPETASLATMSSPPPTPAAAVMPTPVPLSSSPYLANNADDFRDGLIEIQNFTCPDVDGAGQLLWTCSLDGQAIISFYGPTPAKVIAIRVETPPGDPGDWMRGYASIVGTEVYAWVADRVQSDAVSNETEEVGGVWVQTTHDASSDVLLMSTEPLGP
jgi:hypothetical protein